MTDAAHMPVPSIPEPSNPGPSIPVSSIPIPAKSPIGRKPQHDPASVWVRQAELVDKPSKADIYTARLTIDVTPALRARIKVTAFQGGTTAAEMLRALLEREFGGGAP